MILAARLTESTQKPLKGFLTSLTSRKNGRISMVCTIDLWMHHNYWHLPSAMRIIQWLWWCGDSLLYILYYRPGLLLDSSASRPRPLLERGLIRCMKYSLLTLSLPPSSSFQETHSRRCVSWDTRKGWNPHSVLIRMSLLVCHSSCNQASTCDCVFVQTHWRWTGWRTAVWRRSTEHTTQTVSATIWPTSPY